MIGAMLAPRQRAGQLQIARRLPRLGRSQQPAAADQGRQGQGRRQRVAGVDRGDRASTWSPKLREDHPVLILDWPAQYSTEASVPLDLQAGASTGAETSSTPCGPCRWRRGRRSSRYPTGERRTPSEIPRASPTRRSRGRWNFWDVFRLLVQLSLQVTADPSTFALPSLLQSH